MGTNNNEHKIKISLRIETLNSIDLYNDKNSPPHIIVNKEKVKDQMKKQYVFQLSVLGEKRQWRSKFVDDENKYDSAQQKLDTIQNAYKILSDLEVLNFSLESFEKTVRYLQTKIIKEPIKHNDDSDLSSLCSSNENKD